jgi:hypothetical protein
MTGQAASFRRICPSPCTCSLSLSRKRMLAIGDIFVLFSGLMYFAFMAAWLSLFQLLGNLSSVTLAAGVLAVSMVDPIVKTIMRRV